MSCFLQAKPNNVVQCSSAATQPPAFSCRYSSEGKVLPNGAFINHVTRFMNIFELVCEHLDYADGDDDDADVASSQLLILGVTHAGVQDFDFKYFHTFQQCCHHTWEKVIREEYTPDVREAWDRVFAFIVNKIQEGYLMYKAESERELTEGTHDTG